MCCLRAGSGFTATSGWIIAGSTHWIRLFFRAVIAGVAWPAVTVRHCEAGSGAGCRLRCVLQTSSVAQQAVEDRLRQCMQDSTACSSCARSVQHLRCAARPRMLLLLLLFCRIAYLFGRALCHVLAGEPFVLLCCCHSSRRCCCVCSLYW